jgi:methyl-accepting chemotaxis protein
LGSDLVARTGQAIDRVVDKVGEVDALLQRIAGAAADQADRLSDVNASIGQIDHIVSRNAAMVLEATANAEDMREGAQALSRLVRRFARPPSAAPQASEAAAISQFSPRIEDPRFARAK